MGVTQSRGVLVASQVGITDLGLTSDQLRDEIAKLSTPDLVESPFGQLRFFDGVPTGIRSKRSTTPWISFVASRCS
jgi:hypothetical protein